MVWASQFGACGHTKNTPCHTLEREYVNGQEYNCSDLHCNYVSGTKTEEKEDTRTQGEEDDAVTD